MANIDGYAHIMQCHYTEIIQLHIPYVKKTKVMVFSKEENVQCNIKVNGEYLEQVTSYRYLGSIVTEDGRSEV